ATLDQSTGSQMAYLHRYSAAARCVPPTAAAKYLAREDVCGRQNAVRDFFDVVSPLATACRAEPLLPRVARDFATTWAKYWRITSRGMPSGRAIADRSVGHRCGGGVLHDACPRSSSQASSTARARSRLEAMQVWPPAAANRAIKLSCASLGRPPSDFNSNAKPSSRALQQCGHAPGRNRSTSATPGATPRPFMIAASTG